MGRITFQKRQKEMKRQEKQQRKAERRLERKLAKSAEGNDNGSVTEAPSPVTDIDAPSNSLDASE